MHTWRLIHLAVSQLWLKQSPSSLHILFITPMCHMQLRPTQPHPPPLPVTYMTEITLHRNTGQNEKHLAWSVPGVLCAMCEYFQIVKSKGCLLRVTDMKLMIDTQMLHCTHWLNSYLLSFHGDSKNDFTFISVIWIHFVKEIYPNVQKSCVRKDVKNSCGQKRKI